MEGDEGTACSLRRDADSGALLAQASAERIRIKPFVSDGAMSAQAWQQRFDGMQVVTLSGDDTERDGPTAGIHDRGQFGVDPAFRAPDRLRGLAATRIRTVLVKLDMRTVDVAQLAFRVFCRQRQHVREQPGCTPAPETRVHRTPRAEGRRQIAPRHTGAQYIEDRCDHEPVVFRRSTTQVAPAGFSPRPLNFFSPSQSGSGSSNRGTGFMRALRSSRRPTGSFDFENTP